MGKLNIVIFLSLYISTAFSQQTNKISFEAGSVYNKPLIKEELLSSGSAGFTYSYEWQYKYYSTFGYYAKLGFEQKLYSNNKWSIFLPVGLSYINQTDKYYQKGYSWNCFGGGSSDQMVYVNNKQVNFYLGATTQYQDVKWRLAGSLILNNCLKTGSKTRTISDSKEYKYNSFYGLGLNNYSSSQLMGLYNVNKNFWIGPSCELFFGNVICPLNKLMPGRYSGSQNSGPSLNMTGKNVWINPGVRVQMDLK